LGISLNGAVAGFSNAWVTAQNQFHEQHPYHPNYNIAPEVTDEFSLLDSFLHTSLLDDGSRTPDAFGSTSILPRGPQSSMLSGFLNGVAGGGEGEEPIPTPMPPPPTAQQPSDASATAAPQTDDAEAERKYYLQAADPAGNDAPEERMQRVLNAKKAAGLLKPFNYIKGYNRLFTYMQSHIAASSKQKIMSTLAQFRPKFRDKAQSLTDMELVYVEMWFEKQLLEYDRVFASMAIPSCLWRRTGEIYRGNKEMAELIHVPVEQLRDVSLVSSRRVESH